MSRTKKAALAKEVAKAAKAGVTLKEWRAANPPPPTKAAGSGAYLRNRSREEQAYLERHRSKRSKSTGAGSDMGEPSPSGIHAAHVALVERSLATVLEDVDLTVPQFKKALRAAAEGVLARGGPLALDTIIVIATK